MSEFLSYAFVQRALGTGILLGVTCAVLSFFVVLRRMAFVGVGLSHAALGGVALGLVLGAPPIVSAALFTTGVAWVIGWMRGRTEVSEDTAIGVFFPAAMALGVVLISLSPAYRQELVTYLFGNVLSVQPGDVVPLAVLCAAAVGILGYFFKELLFAAVDEEAARAAGVPAGLLDYVLLTLLAVTIIAAVRLVGIILVSAFLVIPAATGQASARSIRGMMTIAIVSAVASVLAGLWLSWAWDLPSGAAIVLASAGLYFVALAVGRRQ